MPARVGELTCYGRLFGLFDTAGVRVGDALEHHPWDLASARVVAAVELGVVEDDVHAREICEYHPSRPEDDCPDCDETDPWLRPDVALVPPF